MDKRLERILPKVQKPARYTGGEYNQIIKDKADINIRVAFCFPDTYEIGMSNLGTQLPSLTPIPGVKLGLANIITVYAIFILSPLDTLIILLCRIFLGSIFSGNMSILLYSLSGGILCYLAMIISKKFLSLENIWICSIIGAIAHNIGQVLIAIFITKTTSLAFYLPVLLLSGIIAGMFTGLTSQYLISKLNIIKNSI